MQRKTTRKRGIARPITVLIMVTLLIIGVLTVDKVSRHMMMIEEKKVLGYQQIDDYIHQFYFCGEPYFIDERQVQDKYNSLKTEVQVFIKKIHEGQKQLVKEES